MGGGFGDLIIGRIIMIIMYIVCSKFFGSQEILVNISTGFVTYKVRIKLTISIKLKAIFQVKNIIFWKGGHYLFMDYEKNFQIFLSVLRSIVLDK